VITDAALMQHVVDTYAPLGVMALGAWDQAWTREGVQVGLRHVGDVDVIAFRGSVDAQDWLRDFQGWPTLHPLLGYCHSGFLQGMDTVAEELGMAVDAGRSFILTGHSLGAARALLVAGLFVAKGRMLPAEVVTFGTPKPGMAKLSGILNHGGFPIRHYRNGPDPIAELPLTLPPLLPYQKPQPDIVVSFAPAIDADDVLRWHDETLYLEALKISAV